MSTRPRHERPDADVYSPNDYLLLVLTGVSYQEVSNTTATPVDEVKQAVESEVSRHVDLDDFDSFEDALDYLRLGRLQRGLWVSATNGGVGESRQLLSVIEQRAELKRSSRPISEDDLIEGTPSITKTLSKGRLETLKALRDHLARSIDECRSKRDLAALSLRFQSVLEEIDEVEGGSALPGDSPADEIAERRRARERARGA